jgi:hypothetical protein
MSEDAVAKNDIAKEKKAKQPKRSTVVKAPPMTREQRKAANQALAMWALLGEGGEAFGGKVKPEIGKDEREALAHAGLIAVEKRERGAFWLVVTEKGWDWAERNLAVPLPEKAFGGAFVLRAWLSRLQGFLQARDLRLAELFVATPGEPPRPPEEPTDLRQRIRRAYHDIAGGFDRRVLLRDLRPRLNDVDRGLVDATLMQMLRDQEISLMQLDYRPDVSGEDHAAALQIGNEPRHLIWISK